MHRATTFDIFQSTRYLHSIDIVLWMRKICIDGSLHFLKTVFTLQDQTAKNMHNSLAIYVLTLACFKQNAWNNLVFKANEIIYGH